MHFHLEIEHISPISSLTFEIDLSQHRLFCITGKNGAGKTTLIKSILNLALADTFVKTSSPGIFDDASIIRYIVEKDEYTFTYDPALRSITTRKPVPPHHQAVASVEMPAPHGQRFTFFRVLADQDDQIRQAVVLGRYEKPTELIRFLSSIYQDSRFDSLVEIQLRRGVCCCIVLPDKRYIREDYFSSGEYFLINLYRKVTQGTPLVVIDEIDISLDSSTQARVAEQLRLLCLQHKSTIVFTSHSLALMQTLEANEIHYLERDETTGCASLSPMSFNGIKSLMFGFQGFDRYILTEDAVLEKFLTYIISRYCSPTFYSYQIICLGGQGYSTGLMKYNIKYGFFGPENVVIGIKDGDQSGNQQIKNVHCIPLQNVEEALRDLYHEENFPHTFDGGDQLAKKPLYYRLIKDKILSTEEIFNLICSRHDEAIRNFSKILMDFLCRPKQ